MDAVLGLVRHSGNEALFQAVEMSMLATLGGRPFHLHAEGLRGTGKTTILRAARRLLPPIQRVKGCLYNCDPAAPHCPAHRHLPAGDLDALGAEWVPMPFLEISHSAKVGTVVGSIDLERLVAPEQAAAALLPGTIPRAHRGILFVDEINRLAETAPELADVLLDVMGTKPGRIQIEETGLPTVQLPVCVSVWAASNPDEDPGPLEDIRRQLSDRFDFTVPTTRPLEAAVVNRILAGPGGESAEATGYQIEMYKTRLVGRQAAAQQAVVPPELRERVADLYARFNLESLRAVQALQQGMLLRAATQGRLETGLGDLAAVAPLALHHRVDAETMKKIVQYLQSLPGSEGGQTPAAVPAGAVAGAAGQPQRSAATKDRPQNRSDLPPPPRQPDRTTAAETVGARRRQHSPWRRAWRQMLERLRARRPFGPAAPGPQPGGRATAPDPSTLPPTAPPRAARPIDQIPLADLVRSEEELRHR